MTHKCSYAEVIGAAPEWITDTADGRVVCNLCHAPKTTKTIEVPVEVEDNVAGDFVEVLAPDAKRVTRTTPRK